MSSVDNVYRFKVVVIGNLKAGKTSLTRRLAGERFSYNYEPTIGVDFVRLQRESIIFELWDTSGHERFRTIVTSYYRGVSVFVYVLDATKEVEENKRMFRQFNRDVELWGSVSNCLQLIVFNKSDDGNSKLSKDYINEFNVFNVPSMVCSAKTNEGVAEIKDKCFNYCKDKPFNCFNESQFLKKSEEDSLVSKIEEYSKKLSKKNSRMAKNKATALEAIAKACRDRGMGQHQIQSSLSIAKIAGIKRIIKEGKETIKQHRHWSVFNCFFNLIDAVSSSVLERRVKSNRLVMELDDYLNTESLRPN